MVLLLATAIPLLWNRSSGLHVDLTDVSGTDDHLARAKRILRETPLVDGHNDFPYLIRQQLHNEIYGYDFEAQRLGAQSDFEKMKRGMMGGQFWSVFVPCPEDIVPPIAVNERKTRVADFNEPNVRQAQSP